MSTSTSTGNTLADQVVYLLRFLGPQREEEMLESLGCTPQDLRQTIPLAPDPRRRA